MRIWQAVSGAALSLTIATTAVSAEEVVLRAVTGVPGPTSVAQVFLKFVDRVNEKGKGVVRIEYLGGPEAIPSARQAQAVQRGLVDIAHMPGSFVSGVFLEVDALLGATLPIEKLHENGAIEALNERLNEQSGLKILGWFDTKATFNLFTNVKPEVKGDTVDLTDVRMFSTPTYRDFQESLGAEPVMMDVGEILTGLQNGVIHGYGWQNYGITALGLTRETKYRIDPSFYSGNVIAVVNAERMSQLPEDARNLLESEARAWEIEAGDFIKSMQDAEEAEMVAAGMEIVTLPDEAAKKYLANAYEALWARLRARSPEHGDRIRRLVTGDDSE